MTKTYTKKIVTYKNTDISASPILDASPQSDSLQRKADLTNNAAQRAEAQRPNNTGMPDNLKSGIESLSGFSMDDVRVHYNSSKPATVQALAYTQGTDIHVAPGQEKHLPHEAWHVAQQMAGRVSPTTNINGMPVNDNAVLEHEADVMGEKAVKCKISEYKNALSRQKQSFAVQRMSFAVTLADGKVLPITEQWDTRDTPWLKLMRDEKGNIIPELRNPKVAILVDEYKRMMLTYIAEQIRTNANKKGLTDYDLGPHISVVITGRRWYISINSYFKHHSLWEKDGVEKKLQSAANEVLGDIQRTFNAFSGDFSSDEKKARYIAYRWAATPIENLPMLTFKKESAPARGCKHGEMQTIDFLQDQLHWRNRDYPNKEKIAGKERVARVGGELIPCYHCALEMFGPAGEGYSHAPLNGRTQIKGFDGSSKDVLTNRRIVTMTDDVGGQFTNWAAGFHYTGATMIPGNAMVPPLDAHQKSTGLSSNADSDRSTAADAAEPDRLYWGEYKEGYDAGYRGDDALSAEAAVSEARQNGFEAGKIAHERKLFYDEYKEGYDAGYRGDDALSAEAAVSEARQNGFEAGKIAYERNLFYFGFFDGYNRRKKNVAFVENDHYNNGWEKGWNSRPKG